MKSEPTDLARELRRSWNRFLDVYEPLRPDLYRYCRHLTRTPWDAEDMAQDTLARAYASLATASEPPPNPRAWLFRVASNLWINRVQATREIPSTLEGHERLTTSEPRAPREAAGTLVARLSPQERAAFVLKDVFDFSLEEVATVLATSEGAVKAALHRGRSKLADPVTVEPEPVAPPVLDAFCAAFNARDLERLTALLLENATMEVPGIMTEHGRAAMREGSLRHTLLGCPEGGYVVDAPLRAEARVHRGEPLLLWWLGDVVDALVRVRVEEDRIALLRTYRHAPECTEEVCRELGVPFNRHGHRPALARLS